MKCPKCGGTGEANMSNGMFAWKVECDECCGGGVVAPLTEEEYIQSCDTEQLADFLTKVILDDKRFRMTMVGGVNETKFRLKQPHQSVTNCNE